MSGSFTVTLNRLEMAIVAHALAVLYNQEIRRGQFGEAQAVLAISTRINAMLAAGPVTQEEWDQERIDRAKDDAQDPDA